MLLHWIESQPTSIITVVVLSGCYALAIVVHFLVRQLAHPMLALELKATTPVMLTPLATMLGLLIAFLAQRVWTNIDHAYAYVGAEISALRQAALLAEALPPEVDGPMRVLIRNQSSSPSAWCISTGRSRRWPISSSFR